MPLTSDDGPLQATMTHGLRFSRCYGPVDRPIPSTYPVKVRKTRSTPFKDSSTAARGNGLYLFGMPASTISVLLNTAAVRILGLN